MSFAGNMGKNVGKNINENLSSTYSQKHFDHANKRSTTDKLKNASKREIQKTAKATGDLIGKKIADKIKRVSKTSPNNISVTNEADEILGEIFILSELRQKNIDNLEIKKENN